MAADVQVSEVDVLKAYSGKMNGLRNDSIALAVLLDRQIRKMIEDYEEVLAAMQREAESAEGACHDLERRYERAFSLCGEGARSVVGNSDMEAKQKVELLKTKMEMTRNSIQNLQMKLKNAGLKTQNYASRMDTLADACISYVNRYAEKLQEYKEIRK
jgi:chromosome segregation ATPase